MEHLNMEIKLSCQFFKKLVRKQNLNKNVVVIVICIDINVNHCMINWNGTKKFKNYGGQIMYNSEHRDVDLHPLYISCIQHPKPLYLKLL